MFVKYRLWMLCLLFIFQSPVLGSDFETALAAYESRDFHAAYKGFRQLAVNRHERAQYRLGLLYLSGQGVGRDIEKGIEWLKTAANNGSYLAAAELGQIYATGREVRMDVEKAAQWIELSTRLAEDGEADEECD